MDSGYLILYAGGGSFGEFSFIPSDVFAALEEGTPEDLSDDIILSLNDSEEEKTIDEIKADIEHVFEADGQSFHCHLANLAYSGRKPNWCEVFPGPTEMVEYMQKNNCTVYGHTF